MVPAFSFIDPFGYKGVTLELLEALMKGWGSDMALFFPFDRINAALMAFTLVLARLQRRPLRPAGRGAGQQR